MVFVTPITSSLKWSVNLAGVDGQGRRLLRAAEDCSSPARQADHSQPLVAFEPYFNSPSTKEIELIRYAEGERYTLNVNLFDLVEAQRVGRSIIQLGCAHRFVSGNPLSMFKLTSVLKIRSNAGCSKRVTAHAG